MSLQQIFDSITPDNIKNIDLIKDAMDIFIANLEENSEISIDIKKIYESDNEIIKENLLKIYLNSLYTVISKAQENKLIADKLENHTADSIPLKRQITDILTNEYLTTNKVFKQKLGTKPIIEYSYNLAKYLQDNIVNADDFSLTEVKPFYFQTEGSIYNEVYEYIVKPLSHPIGFTHNYIQVIKDSLTDYFGLIVQYNFNQIEVRCLNGYFDIFTSDDDDIAVKADFLTRTNFLTGQLFTEVEYNTYITVWTNKIAIDLKFENINGSTDRIVHFDDGTIIKQTGSPINVYYRNLSDDQENNDQYIKQYNSQCSLYVDYEQSFNTTYTDEILIELISDFGTDTYDMLTDINEVFDIGFINNTGYYLYTSDSQYLFTSDAWYMKASS